MYLEEEKRRLKDIVGDYTFQLKAIEEKIKQSKESKKETELRLKKQVLTDYFADTEKELNAYSKFFEKEGRLPMIADCFVGCETQIEWKFESDYDTYDPPLRFNYKQDYWLIYEKQYITYGSEDDMTLKVGENDYDWRDTVIKPIVSKSTLLKREKWILKQLSMLSDCSAN